MKHPIKNPIKSRGISLIEVLITTLVIAVGLLAVASLQGNLMSGSSLNKTRAEALQLANVKMEQLRDQIEKTGYDALVSGKDAAVDGTNASFVRYWLVTTATDPARKTIQVKVAWGPTGVLAAAAANAAAASTAADGSATVVEEQIVVQSVVSYDKIAVSFAIAKAASTANTSLTLTSPTTNAGSSYDINDSTTVAITGGTAGQLVSTTPNAEGQYIKATTSTKGAIVYRCSGQATSVTIAGVVTTVVPFINFENGLYTRRFNYDEDVGGFKEVIELAVSNGDTLFSGTSSCTRKVRYMGGIIIPIKGRVYNTADSSGISVLGLNSSESGVFCVYSASTSSSFPYACYVGGNCRRETVGGNITTTDGLSNTYYGLSTVPFSAPAGSTAVASPTTAPVGSNTIVTQCPALPAASLTPSIYGPADCISGACLYDSIGHGGWRGKVGLLGLITGNVSRTSCFTGTISNAVNGTPESERPATAREYFSLRYDSTQASPYLSNEGINKSYLCHDFLIVGTSGQDNCTVAAKGALALASKTIVRASSGVNSSYSFYGTGTTDPNKVGSVDTSSCHVISGTTPSGVTKVDANSANGGFECTMPTTTSYTCTGTSQAASVSIIGKNSGGSGVAAYTASLSNSTLSVTNANLVAVTFYSVTGSITAVTPVTLGTATGNFDPLTQLFFSDSSCVVTHPSNYVYTCSLPASSSVTFYAGLGYLTSPTLATQTGTGVTTTNITINARTAVNVSVGTNGSGIVTGLAVTGSGVTCGAVSGYSSTCTGAAGWSGTVTATGTCNGSTITSPAATVAATDTQVTATLPTCDLVPHALTVTSPSNGTINDDLTTPVNINCRTTAPSATTCSYTGTSITLNAVADAGYVFTGWGGTGACSPATTNPCTVDLSTAAKGISATFAATRTVTVTATIATGTGTISSVSLSPLGSCTPSAATAASTVLTCTGVSTTSNTTITVTLSAACSSSTPAKFNQVAGANVNTSGVGTVNVLAGTSDTTATIAVTKAGSGNCP